MAGPDYRRYATPLHDEHAVEMLDVLADMLMSYAGDDRRRMLGYCMGMCCHYSLDRITHPFIYWLEEQMCSSDSRGPDYKYHGEIESMLDVIMLRRETGLLPCEVDLRECLPEDGNAAELIAHIYANVLGRVFSVKGNMGTLRALVSDMRTAFRFLNDRYAVKRRAVAAVEKLFGGKGQITAFMRPIAEDLDYDYANLCRREWRSPQQPDICGSSDFPQMYESASDDARHIADLFMKAARGEGELDEYTGRITFSGYALPSKTQQK